MTGHNTFDATTDVSKQKRRLDFSLEENLVKLFAELIYRIIKLLI